MDCLTWLKNRYAGKLDEDALLGLFEEAKRERAQLQRRIGSVGDLEEKLLERLQGRVADAETIAKAHRRAAMLQLTKRLEAFDFVMQNFHGREEEGLSALIVGSNRTIEGSRNSVDANQSAFKGWYLGGLSSDLKALSPQHFDIFRKGGYCPRPVEPGQPPGAETGGGVYGTQGGAGNSAGHPQMAGTRPHGHEQSRGVDGKAGRLHRAPDPRPGKDL